MKMKKTFLILLLLLAGACLTSCASLPNPRVLSPSKIANQKSQSQIRSRGSVYNVPVNIVGGEALVAMLSIIALMGFGWFIAAKGRSVREACLQSVINGIETTGTHSKAKTVAYLTAKRRGVDKQLDRFVSKQTR